MKTKTSNKKITIEVPTSWKEITLGKFRNYQMIENKESMSNLELKMLTVEIFCDLKAKNVRSLSIKDLNRVYKEVTKLISSKQPSFKFKQIFKFKGKRLGFIPNLSKISTGEWADFEELMRQGGYWKNAHKVMSILWREIDSEIGDKYSIKEYDESHIENSDQYLELGMDKVIGAQTFFLRLGLDLLRTLRTSTLEEQSLIKRGNLTDLITQLQKSTGGITRSL
tara:strand:- start:229 stop:900 length:672 start_codon:yes stop_codon:yes gene_type:complete